MKYLGIKEITTQRQRANGTRNFALPYYIRGKQVTITSYKSGYVRIDRNCHATYQVNPTYKVPYKVIDRDGKLKTRTITKRIMIYGEESRIDFIFNYVLKNFYKKQWK